MNKLIFILLLAGIGLLVAACTTPGGGGVKSEPTEAVSPASAKPTSEPTPEPAAPEEEATEDTVAGEAFDPSTLRYPLLQILDKTAIVLTSYRFDYTSAGGIQDLADGYAAAMEPQGCRPYADAGGQSGVSAGYLCLGLEEDELDDFTFSVSFAFEPEGARNVGLSFGNIATPEFNLPIPDDAEDVEEWGSGATFSIPSDTLEDLFLGIEAQNCEPHEELGSPEGGVYKSFICLDEAGKPVLTLGVNYESADVTSVSMSVDALSPQYVLTAFPDGAQDFTYGADQTLRFNTSTPFESVYAFYTSDNEPFSRADCTLVGETGGAGGATSMQLLCMDHYTAKFTYEFRITMVITEAENGAAVQMTIEE